MYSSPSITLNNLGISAITYSKSRFHTGTYICLTDVGEVFSWENGKHGILGHGDTTSHSTSERVEVLDVVKVKQVDCGYCHCAVCTEDGEIYTFGDGKQDQLGQGDYDDRFLVLPSSYMHWSVYQSSEYNLLITIPWL